MTHLLLWGNAYSQIIRNARGESIALLEEDSTIRNFRIVQTEGSRQVTRLSKFGKSVFLSVDSIRR